MKQNITLFGLIVIGFCLLGNNVDALDCPKDMKEKGGKCVCIYGVDTHYKGAAIKCNPKPQAITCGEHEKLNESGARCDCVEGYIADKGGNCLECAENYEVWPVDSGTCVKKCGEGEIRSDSGTCVQECPANEEKKDDKCTCKEGYGRYQAADDFGVALPCLPCGSDGEQVISNGVEICDCDKNYHRDIDGTCIPANESCSVATAIQDEKYPYDCRCEDGYGIKLVGKNVTCEKYELCASGKIWSGGTCIDIVIPPPPPPTPAASGDCGCNFGSASSTIAQMLLPYLALAVGGIGLGIWRRSSRL